MRVNTKVVSMIETGEIVERVAHEYFGPVAKAGGWMQALENQNTSALVKNIPITLVATGNLVVNNSMYLLAKTVAGVITITLADPIVGVDDGKEVIFVNNQAQVNILSGSFLSVGVAKTTATFTAGLVGEFIRLKASQGKWLVLDIVTTGGATMS